MAKCISVSSNKDDLKPCVVITSSEAQAKCIVVEPTYTPCTYQSGYDYGYADGLMQYYRLDDRLYKPCNRHDDFRNGYDDGYNQAIKDQHKHNESSDKPDLVIETLQGEVPMSGYNYDPITKVHYVGDHHTVVIQITSHVEGIFYPVIATDAEPNSVIYDDRLGRITWYVGDNGDDDTLHISVQAKEKDKGLSEPSYISVHTMKDANKPVLDVNADTSNNGTITVLNHRATPNGVREVVQPLDRYYVSGYYIALDGSFSREVTFAKGEATANSFAFPKKDVEVTYKVMLKAREAFFNESDYGYATISVPAVLNPPPLIDWLNGRPCIKEGNETVISTVLINRNYIAGHKYRVTLPACEMFEGSPCTHSLVRVVEPFYGDRIHWDNPRPSNWLNPYEHRVHWEDLTNGTYATMQTDGNFNDCDDPNPSLCNRWMGVAETNNTTTTNPMLCARVKHYKINW